MRSLYTTAWQQRKDREIAVNKYKYMNREIKISDYNYPLPDERIAKFPLESRDQSKILIYRDSQISEDKFSNLESIIPKESMLVFNNTKVIHARIIMHKPSGARVEVFCLEPESPADYERAFATHGSTSWSCIIGNSKKWKEGHVEINFDYNGKECKLRAFREESTNEKNIVRFEWDTDMTFGQMLEHLGKIPIPPYLNRDTEEIDQTRYQTVYSKFEGSVAAPTAGLHFSSEQIERMKMQGIRFEEVTLHVGAGTFLPVKCENAAEHHMHTEHFDITLKTLNNLIENYGLITAVGTTTVRTLESISALGYRTILGGSPDECRTIGQWELYDIPTEIKGIDLLSTLRDYMQNNNIERLKASTCIMITNGFTFRVVTNIITNFHQPKSTLLLLVSAMVGDDWKRIYSYALENEFRFLSYGDSSIIFGKGVKR